MKERKMISGVNNSATTPDANAANTPASNQKTDPLADKSTFLQLLVAQIKNQDPMQPQDGVQFISQLAQFSGLEQSMNMNKELEAIHTLLAAQAEAASKVPAPATGK
jgi:flagellar basal-body rod modification protein FlgD